METLNWPNFLTVVRILLVPVIVVALVSNTQGGDVLAAIVFALASVTDFVDGYLARSRDSVTTFGKLMDPLADKLLIVAALISLVSLHRLAAWVAMVIIARELAVTVMRMGALQAGVIIAASNLAKLKTCVQIAAILSVIAVHGHPTWLNVLVYAAVAITVLSGLDYFFGLRRRIEQAHRRLAVRELPAELAQGAVALSRDVVLVDRLEVLLARGDERLVGQLRQPREYAVDHLAHAVLDEAGAAVGLLDDGDLVDALHQLVDLRGHRVLDDVEQRPRVDLERAGLRHADVERAEAALVVGRERDRVEDALDL